MCKLGAKAQHGIETALDDIPAPRIPFALPFWEFGHWLAQAQQETVPDA